MTTAVEQTELNDDGSSDGNEGGVDAGDHLVTGILVSNLGQSTTEVEDMLPARGSPVDLPQGISQPPEPAGGLFLIQPALSSSPINEHDTGLDFLVRAFPFLFPQGTMVSPTYT